MIFLIPQSVEQSKTHCAQDHTIDSPQKGSFLGGGDCILQMAKFPRIQALSGGEKILCFYQGGLVFGKIQLCVFILKIDSKRFFFAKQIL